MEEQLRQEQTLCLLFYFFTKLLRRDSSCYPSAKFILIKKIYLFTIDRPAFLNKSIKYLFRR